jgi:hypothetical protein
VERDVHAPFTYDVIHRAIADTLERRVQTSIASTGLVRNTIDYHFAIRGKRLRVLNDVCDALESCGALAVTATWLRQAAEAAIRHP